MEIGVLIEVNSETDFVAKNEEFKQFVRDMAMQVASIHSMLRGRSGSKLIEGKRDI